MDIIKKEIELAANSVNLSTMSGCPFCNFTEEKYKKHKEQCHGDAQTFEEYTPLLLWNRLLNTWYVECQSCGIEFILNTKDNKEAIDFWNKRAT
jgi:hypothetical protein